MNTNQSPAALKRVVSLPMLVFYGVGVTVGAGIFALTGEVVAISGNGAALSFMVAAFIAGLTAVSYSVLSNDAPKAAGEAWYVRQAFGAVASVLMGLLLVCSAIFSSAAITVSFSNYFNAILPVPEAVLVGIALVVISLVAWKGIKETVVFAAVVTLIEVGALLTVVVAGFPNVIDGPIGLSDMAKVPDLSALSLMLSGAVVAFFAFIGFEDIVNMGEEAIDAERNLPIAIIATLVITLIIYFLVSLVSIAVPDRNSFLQSDAPLAHIYEVSTGRNPWIISLCAAIAMVNGILVQIVMSSRVLYGLARAGSLPRRLGFVDSRTGTPSIAIALVAICILLLAMSFSLVHLAIYSSMVLLIVFSAVNLSLWQRARSSSDSRFRRWSSWGLISFVASFSLLAWQLFTTISGAIN